MKKQLLIAFLSLGFLSTTAQTTHNLNWFAGMGSNVDLTIETGDTVIWTWTSPNHTVENVPGSSVETFNSGFLGPNGSTFSYTFTVIGDNDYFCGIHGANSMSGTITVTDNLGVADEDQKLFKIVSNPTSDYLTIQFPQTTLNGELTVHDVLGNLVLTQSLGQDQIMNIDISNFNTGMYLLAVESEDKKETQRFIKK